jgi:hypothetical protein
MHDELSSTSDTHSQIARILAEIEAQQRAAQWAITGIANGHLRHRFITRRLAQMGAYHEQLTETIGDRDQAMGLLLKQLDATWETGTQPTKE